MQVCLQTIYSCDSALSSGSGDGVIQHRELQHVMRACMEENGMKFSEEQIDDLTMALFEDADADNRGTITYEALKNQLEKHGGLLENLSIRWEILLKLLTSSLLQSLTMQFTVCVNVAQLSGRNRRFYVVTLFKRLDTGFSL